MNGAYFIFFFCFELGFNFFFSWLIVYVRLGLEDDIKNHTGRHCCLLISFYLCVVIIIIIIIIVYSLLPRWCWLPLCFISALVFFFYSFHHHHHHQHHWFMNERGKSSYLCYQCGQISRPTHIHFYFIIFLKMQKKNEKDIADRQQQWPM